MRNITSKTPKSDDGQLLLDTATVLQLFGISAPTLGGWHKEAFPPPRDERSGLYPARDIGEWIRKRQTLKFGRGQNRPYLPDGVVIADTPKKGLPSAQETYDQARIRSEAAKADKLEMENAQTRGELVLAADVEKGWADILSRVKTRVMQVPYTAAMMVVGDDDMSSVQLKLKDIVRDALLELSADWRDVGDEDD